jgi:hypothetical protein
MVSPVDPRMLSDRPQAVGSYCVSAMAVHEKVRGLEVGV